MVLQNIYGFRILFADKKFCEFIFRKDINRDNILDIINNIYNNSNKNAFTFEILVKNENINLWNLWSILDNYSWIKVSTSKFNNFVYNKEEFILCYVE